MQAATFFPLLILSGLAVLLLCACSSSQNRLTVTEADYGESWPLTIPEATLICREPSLVWVESDDVAYPLNGIAKTHLPTEQPGLIIGELEAIWRIPDSFWEEEKLLQRSFPDYVPGSQGVLRVNIGPLIDDGLDLCE